MTSGEAMAREAAEMPVLCSPPEFHLLSFSGRAFHAFLLME